MMKNVRVTNSSDYTNDLIKSLSNFCSKTPLNNVEINHVKDMNKIYVKYEDLVITIDIDPNYNKKVVIGNVKKKLQKYYPCIYKTEKRILNSDEIEKMISNGMSIKEAIEKKEDVEVKIFKVIRAHQNYNELDLLSFEDNEMYKYKCKIPVSLILERLKYKDTTVMNELKLMYKLEKRDR